jgi:hypothetical protein
MQKANKMQRQTYSVEEDREYLVYEETYDDNNNLIHYIDHQARPVSEKKFEYDDKHQLIKESEISDGVELQGLEMTYDEKGKVVEQNLLFSGDLYESVKMLTTDNGYVNTTYLDGEEVHRIENIADGKNFVSKHFDYENLSNVEVYKYDEESSTAERLIYDAEENLLVRRVENFDDNGELAIFKEFNAENKLIRKQEFEREDKKLVKEVKSDFVRGEIDNEVHYDYDENGNVVKSETRTNSGKLVDFQVYGFDENNRLVEESGVSNGKFNAIYGTYIDGNKYHFIHKYV